MIGCVHAGHGRIGIRAVDPSIAYWDQTQQSRSSARKSGARRSRHRERRIDLTSPIRSCHRALPGPYRRSTLVRPKRQAGELWLDNTAERDRKLSAGIPNPDVGLRIDAARRPRLPLLIPDRTPKIGVSISMHRILTS